MARTSRPSQSTRRCRLSRALRAVCGCCLRVTIPRPATFPEIGLERLQIFLTSPWQVATSLYELIANHCVGLAIARHADDPDAVFLSADHVRAMGFERDEGMLPYPANSFEGYRLLAEFFAFSFRSFVGIDGLERWQAGDCVLYLYFDATDSRLERLVSADDFALNSAPIINLFRQECEPISLDGTRTEYRLIPDARRQATREIYRVEEVHLSTPSGLTQEAQPFFGRSQASASAAVFWQIYRRIDEDDGTSDIDIAFVDRQRGPLEPFDAIAGITTLCLNRNLPSQLPYGGGHPFMHLAAGNEAVATVQALMPPTPVIRMNSHASRDWRLVSHLLLNHLSLFEFRRGAEGYSFPLRLYRFTGDPPACRLDHERRGAPFTCADRRGDGAWHRCHARIRSGDDRSADRLHLRHRAEPFLRALHLDQQFHAPDGHDARPIRARRSLAGTRG